MPITESEKRIAALEAERDEAHGAIRSFLSSLPYCAPEAVAEMAVLKLRPVLPAEEPSQ